MGVGQERTFPENKTRRGRQGTEAGTDVRTRRTCGHGIKRAFPFRGGRADRGFSRGGPWARGVPEILSRTPKHQDVPCQSHSRSTVRGKSTLSLTEWALAHALLRNFLISNATYKNAWDLHTHTCRAALSNSDACKGTWASMFENCRHRTLAVCRPFTEHLGKTELEL